MKNIVLTGFMGTGKTSVGRLLAARTGRAFVDTDEVIVQRSGKEIAQIFARFGAQTFRELEREVALGLAPLQDLVIATGGGMMLDEANAAALREESLVLCLQAEPEEVLARVTADGGTRPLLEVPDAAQRVADLLAERAAGYGQFPQVATDGKAPQEVVDEIMTTYDIERADGDSTTSRRLTVAHPQGHYEVIVGRGLLGRLGKLAPLPGGNVAVISDSHVGPLFGTRISEAGTRLQGTVERLQFPAGESHKSLDTARELYAQLLEVGLDRSGAIVALGGGVVGDVGGFVAATYMRGVPLVQCPTTLLAMVDASVGGKTGVDLPQGKNLVGAFKQPVAVLADVDTLRTLPPAEFAAGMAEVIKHGLLAGGALLKMVEHAEWRQEVLFQQGNEEYLVDLVAAAIAVKRDVVQEDPYEKGRRATLNLGHTFAHAIERQSRYAVGHGYAVGMGLVAAARLSAKLGHCDELLQEQVEDLLRRFTLPVRIPPGVNAKDLLEAMGSDKKKEQGQLRFILIRGAGDVFISSDVPAAAVIETIEELQNP